eukprot:357723-Chlamydomonas_euryale.AAC.1
MIILSLLRDTVQGPLPAIHPPLTSARSSPEHGMLVSMLRVPPCKYYSLRREGFRKRTGERENEEALESVNSCTRICYEAHSATSSHRTRRRLASSGRHGRPAGLGRCVSFATPRLPQPRKVVHATPPVGHLDPAEHNRWMVSHGQSSQTPQTGALQTC